MVSALILSNNFLRRGKAENISISPMKLQKLLYFTHATYLKMYKEPLVSDVFETWKYGPVVLSVYDYFKYYGANNITGNFISSDKQIYVLNEEKRKDARAIIDIIWEKYKNKSGTDLANISHNKDSAWFTQYSKRMPFIDNDVIEKEKVQWEKL